MQWFDLSLDTPEENLACDEALLEACEAGEIGHDVLRFWESPRPFAVVGYAGKLANEVDAAQCRRDDLPVLRRVSGGGTVLQGPGCLNVSLLLRIERTETLRSIDGTNDLILGRHGRAFESVTGSPVAARGSSDLAIGDLKFSGNAQRRKRDWILYHGTVLHDYDLPRIERNLPIPGRQPAYRANRSHLDFLVNLAPSPGPLREALAREWDARAAAPPAGLARRIERLVADRYGRPAWNERF